MLHQYGGQGAMAAASTFSLFFPVPVEEARYSCDDRSHGSTVTASASPSSPLSSSSSAGTVDCTLSLGTPSSRHAQPGPVRGAPPPPYPPVHAAALSWDAAAECYYHQQQGKPTTAAASRGAAVHDQFLDRRCANCGTSTTPLWRNGPRGPKSLCNACGIRFKKEERRAAEGGAAATAAAAHHHQQQHRAPRAGAPVLRGPAPHHHADADAPFTAAWRLNVAPAPAAPAFPAWPELASCVFQHN